MDMKHVLNARNVTWRLAGAAGLFLMMTGCVQERSNRESRLIVPKGEAYERVERLDSVPGAPLLMQSSLSTSFSLHGLGEIEYDGFTLPIMHSTPDTCRIAVQDGARPSWSALLAESVAGASASSVSIHELDQDSNPRLVVKHEGPLILGRTSNARGVLVERPNRDGSRWIGLAPWDGTDIQWLVSDNQVNAFAWITEDDTLAFARRTVGGERFKLVVKAADGTSWTLPESLPYSWILPTIDVEGEGLFAIRHGDGYADMTWGRIQDAAFFRQTLNTRRMSDRVDMQRAWQMLSGSTGRAGMGPGKILWFSFELGRLVGWDPSEGRTFLMPENSVAAFLTTRQDEWLVTFPGMIQLVVFVQGSSVETRLFESPWIARGTSNRASYIIQALDRKLILAEIVAKQNLPED